MINYSKLREGLGSVFESLTADSLIYVMDRIEKYRAELSAKIGVFLQNDLKLRTAKSDINAIMASSDPTISGTSGALLQQMGVLQTNQDSLMGSSTKLITALMDYKTRVATTAPLKDIITGRLSMSMITDVVQLSILTKAISDGATLTNQASTMLKAVDAQNTAVDRLIGQVADTLGALKGTGSAPNAGEILAPIENLMSEVSKAPAWLLGVGSFGLLVGTLYLAGALKKRKA